MSGWLDSDMVPWIILKEEFFSFNRQEAKFSSFHFIINHPSPPTGRRRRVAGEGWRSASPGSAESRFKSLLWI